MKTVYLLWCAMVFLPLALVGCKDASDKAKAQGTDKGQISNKSSDKQEQEAEVQANLAKLSPDDRKLAEEQRFCVIQKRNRLGSMDVPVKVMVKGQPVFVCCKGCVRKALNNPDQTLTKVQEFRAKVLDSPGR